LLGMLGVSAFFVLSGFLMYRQSAKHFAVRGRATVFVFRRFIRVVPLYWIAVTVYVAVVRFQWHLPLPHLGRQYALAMIFLPNPYNPPFMHPVLAHGWTLNYEMFFYALFSVCLLLPRKRGLALLVGLLTGLFLAGWWIPQLPQGLGQSIRWFYTRKDVLLFLAGVLMAVFEKHLVTLTSRRLSFSPAYFLLAPAAIVVLCPLAFSGPDPSDRIFLLAILAVFFCTLGREQITGLFERILVLLGDASYSTYLFHPWVYLFLFPVLKKAFHGGTVPLALYLATSLVAGNLLGVAIHFVLERPLMGRLQSLAFPKDRRLHAAVEQPNLGV
jgi:exopolysaccharide production protein ExoZ